jgi:hypothetical protein
MRTYAMEKSRIALAVDKIHRARKPQKSMKPHQHHELEPLRKSINQRNWRTKFGQVLEIVRKNPDQTASISDLCCEV